MRLRPAPLLFRSGLLAFAVTLFCVRPCFALDLLLVERPGSLTIYNRFQQEITFEERALFRPFVPMVIVDKDALLNDGFTPCMMVRVDGAVFYLLKGEGNAPVNLNRAGISMTLTGCTAPDDTVRVLKDRNIVLYLRPASKEVPDTLAAGVLVRRLYRKNGQDYGEAVGQPEHYGWGVFSSKTQDAAWEKIEKKVVAARNESAPVALQQRVEALMAGVNTTLRELFDLLNRSTGQSRTPPQWRVASEADRLVCALSDPSLAGRFSGSAEYVIQDIEKLVRPEGFIVEHRDGAIVIRRAP